MGHWFQEEIIANDRLALFLCFLAFVVTFFLTRMITGMIRAGRGPFKDNVSKSGVHVHHAVPGIILLVSGAVMSVATGSEAPWAEIAAVLIGIGTSLVLDEFALILHMADVYWDVEGRISVEMVSLAIACMGLALVGVSPLSFDGDPVANAAIATTVALALVHIGVIILCIVKGKYELALLSTFVPLLGLVYATRLARPGSKWAQRFYRGAKAEEAERRAERFDARFGRYIDFIGDFIANKPARTPAQAVEA